MKKLLPYLTFIGMTVIALLLLTSCHTLKDYLYEESKYLDDGSIRNVKYWIDRKGNVQGQIDTVKSSSYMSGDTIFWQYPDGNFDTIIKPK